MSAAASWPLRRRTRVRPTSPLLRAAKEVWPYILGSVAQRLGVSATYVVQALLVAHLLAALLRGEGLGNAHRTLVPLALVIVVRLALTWGTERMAHETASATKERLRASAFAKLAELGPGFVGSKRTGELQVTLVSGIESLETYLSRYLPAVIVACVVPASMVALLATYDARLAAVVGGLALAVGLVPRLFHARLGEEAASHWEEYLALGADFLDSVQGLVTLKSLGASDVRQRHLAAKSDFVATRAIRALVVALSQQGIVTALLLGGSAAVVVLASARVAREELAAGTLFLALFLAREALRPFGELSASFHASLDGRSAATQLAALHEAEPHIADPAFPMTIPANTPASIEFEEVSFRYAPGEPLVLDRVSFRVAPGETVAIVGPSGAGKSTLSALLLRFFDPESGRVLAFGRDLRRITSDDLRARIGVVSQETYLFAGTVLDNLRLAKPDASRADIEDAARAADAHEFIAALPDGYDTVLGERGARLSGGQRQRLALARALLKDAPILVLDEATSSLDAESEERITAALARSARSRTALVIAHRLSAVAHADRIVVLEGGRIVETGPREMLARSNGAYARLVAAQEIS
ncbi:ABC transporter ATP-binding protein [Sorangium sp. So ce134]